MAELYLKQNKFEEALNNALLAEKISQELNAVIKFYQASLIISTIYEAMGNTSLALKYYKKYHQSKDEILSPGKRKKDQTNKYAS